MRKIVYFLQGYFADKNRRVDLYCLLSLLAAFGLLLWSGRYPVMVRDHLDTSLRYWLSFIFLVSVLAMYPINHRLYRFTGREREWGTSLFHWMYFGFPVFLALLKMPVLLNGLLDTSLPQSHATTLMDKYISSSGRSSSRNLILHDWQNPSQTAKFAVPSDFYERKAIGDTLHFTTRKGALGYEWVVDYR